MTRLTESAVEDAALERLEAIGWQVVHGPDIAPGEPAAGRPSYEEVILAGRLRDALVRLNPALPAEAVEEAFRKVCRADSPSLIQGNRLLHRMRVDGVDVEYQAEGRVVHDKARLIDKSARLSEVRRHRYVLTPGRYVGAEPLELDQLEREPAGEDEAPEGT